MSTEEARVKPAVGTAGATETTSGGRSPPVTETYHGVRLKYFATWVCRRKR
jgi:hypothetical protein